MFQPAGPRIRMIPTRVVYRGKIRWHLIDAAPLPDFTAWEIENAAA